MPALRIDDPARSLVVSSLWRDDRPVNAARAALNAACSEAQFSEWFRQLCKVRHLFAYHTRDSRRSTEGYPDWTVVLRDGGLVFAELKTEKGEPSRDQLLWGAALSSVEEATGGRVRYRVWRPSDRDEIERLLV